MVKNILMLLYEFRSLVTKRNSRTLHRPFDLCKQKKNQNVSVCSLADREFGKFSDGATYRRHKISLNSQLVGRAFSLTIMSHGHQFDYT